MKTITMTMEFGVSEGWTDERIQESLIRPTLQKFAKDHQFNTGSLVTVGDISMIPLSMDIVINPEQGKAGE